MCLCLKLMLGENDNFTVEKLSQGALKHVIRANVTRESTSYSVGSQPAMPRLSVIKNTSDN